MAEEPQIAQPASVSSIEPLSLKLRAAGTARVQAGEVLTLRRIGERLKNGSDWIDGRRRAIPDRDAIAATHEEAVYRFLPSTERRNARTAASMNSGLSFCETCPLPG